MAKILPFKGTPDWHKIQIAKKTVNMTPQMTIVMGGMTVKEAEDILNEYGLLNVYKKGNMNKEGLFEREREYKFPYEMSNVDYVSQSHVSGINAYPYHLTDEMEEKMYDELGLKKYSLSQYELMMEYAKLKGWKHYRGTQYEKGGEFFEITGSGLKRVTNKINILPNRVYYMGASSSPETAVVTKVDKDWITYRRYPFYKDLKIEYWIGQSLIASGSKTWLKNYANVDNEWVVERRKSLEDLFAGGTGTEENPDDLKRVEVIIGVTSDNNDFDAWSEFEKMYPYSVSSASNDGRTLKLYESFGLAKKRVNELENNKHFKVEKISEEKTVGEPGKVLYENGTHFGKGGIVKTVLDFLNEKVYL